MSLLFSKEGQNIAVIKDNVNYKDKIISTTTDDIPNTFKTLKLNTGNFQPIGNYNAERSCNLIVGASGSGKSRYICNWVLEYKKKYKKNPVYLFSSLTEDVSLKPIKPLRIILDEEFMNEAIDLEMYRNSCCIFDDTDTIQHKYLKEKVYTLMNMMLNTGRHYNITVWVVSHTPTGKKLETKVIMNEAHSIVIFPANDNKQLRYLLENYCGIDNKQMKFLKSLNSRWCCINKHYPQSIITEKHILMMSEISGV